MSKDCRCGQVAEFTEDGAYLCGECFCSDCHGEGMREVNWPADEDGPEQDVMVYCSCPAGEELQRTEWAERGLA